MSGAQLQKVTCEVLKIKLLNHELIKLAIRSQVRGQSLHRATHLLSVHGHQAFRIHQDLHTLQQRLELPSNWRLQIAGPLSLEIFFQGLS